MKIYKTQKEVEKDIKNGMLVVNESVEFKCSINIDASLKIAGDINARDINAKDIKAWDINAKDINARDINAKKISYYAFCCVYNSIKCFSIRGTREKCAKPLVIDGEINIKEAEK